MKRYTLLPAIRQLIREEQSARQEGIDLETARLRDKYVAFATGEFMPATQAKKDFFRICRMPGVKMIGFAPSGKELFVATEHVYLRKDAKDELRDIGEFIISICRVPSSKFHFENLTPLKTLDSRGSVGRYHHPHIPPSGNICLQGGELEIKMAIAEGDMPTVVQLLWIALNSLGPGIPFLSASIENWPLKKDA